MKNPNSQVVEPLEGLADAVVGAEVQGQEPPGMVTDHGHEAVGGSGPVFERGHQPALFGAGASGSMIRRSKTRQVASKSSAHPVIGKAEDALEIPRGVIWSNVTFSLLDCVAKT